MLCTGETPFDKLEQRLSDVVAQRRSGARSLSLHHVIFNVQEGDENRFAAAPKIVAQIDFPGDWVMPGTIRDVDEPTTRRERIVRALGGEVRELEDLRGELEMTVADLEDDLRHIERSLRARSRRLRVDGAECQDCGFRLRSRGLHRPGRCPRCRGHHLRGPWLRIA